MSALYGEEGLGEGGKKRKKTRGRAARKVIQAVSVNREESCVYVYKPTLVLRAEPDT